MPNFLKLPHVLTKLKKCLSKRLLKNNPARQFVKFMISRTLRMHAHDLSKPAKTMGKLLCLHFYWQETNYGLA